MIWPTPVCMFLQSPDGDAQTLTEVDLFISTQRIKVLNADSQVSTSEHTHYMFLSKVPFLPSFFYLSHPLSYIRLHNRGVLLCHSCHKSSLTADTNWFLWNPSTDCFLFVCFFNLMTSPSEFPLTEDKNGLCEAKKCCTDICAWRATQRACTEQGVWLQHNLPSLF